jgi:ribonuclease BN (tRNA processing enzyme)
MSELYVLGGGTPTPTPERFGSSYVIKLDNHNSQIMFDCGPALTSLSVAAGPQSNII